MQDRVPTPGQEGRVLITPENGSSPFYAKVEMADNPTQPGTPLNKATLLKDATALLFGLTTEAVPDDALNLLSRFQNGLGNEYIWKKYLQTSGYVLAYGPVIKQNFNDTSKMYASSSVTVDAETGEITFVNPQKVPSDMASAARFVRRKYIYFLNGSTKTDMLYIKSATYSDSLGGSVDYTYQDISSVYKTNISEESYVNSPDPEAYPPKVPDGYQYSGPFQLGTFAVIETGSYVGTGTSGSSNPNTLTASGHIKAAFISQDDASAGTSVPMINPSHTAMVSPNPGSANSISVTWGDKNVSFYASSAINQLNANGVTYGYLLIL